MRHIRNGNALLDRLLRFMIFDIRRQVGITALCRRQRNKFHSCACAKTDALDGLFPVPNQTNGIQTKPFLQLLCKIPEGDCLRQLSNAPNALLFPCLLHRINVIRRFLIGVCRKHCLHNGVYLLSRNNRFQTDFIRRFQSALLTQEGICPLQRKKSSLACRAKGAMGIGTDMPCPCAAHSIAHRLFIPRRNINHDFL